MRRPIAAALASPTESMISSVARPAAAQTGFPANVEPCAPGGQVQTESRAMKAPIGMPEAIPLAVVRMSGSTPVCSIAHHAPVSPIPDWISSATRRMPCSSQISLRPCMNAAGAGK